MTVGVILAAPGVPRNLSERYLPSHVFHVMKLMLLLHSGEKNVNCVYLA